MKHNFSQSAEDGLLALSGELLIENSSELKSALCEALASSPRLIVDLGKVTAADISSLQLLCSAHRSASLAGTSFRIDQTGEAIRSIAENAGYSCRTKGCRFAIGICLWDPEAQQARG